MRHGQQESKGRAAAEMGVSLVAEESPIRPSIVAFLSIRLFTDPKHRKGSAGKDRWMDLVCAEREDADAPDVPEELLVSQAIIFVEPTSVSDGQLAKIKRLGLGAIVSQSEILEPIVRPRDV